jgi:outer membrane protein OmpA-like peptidoglycan-associated protein
MSISDDKEATYEIRIKIDPPKSFILDNVYFDTGKSTLKSSSFKALTDLVEVLKLKSNMFIEIQGHTDNVGSEESNLKLSQDRADAVKNYLVNKGISNDRITSIGYGQSMPIDYNSSEEGKAKNRRTSLKVIKE